MKKIIITIVLTAVVLTALATASLAFAQGPAQAGQGAGVGNRGSRGGMQGAGMTGTQDGILHDEMIAAYAARFGLSVETLNNRLAAGETMSQIAFSQGLTLTEFRSLMVEVRAQAIAKAVENGDLTQAQANWMNQRGTRMGGGRGMQGAGLAGGNCPYATTTSTP